MPAKKGLPKMLFVGCQLMYGTITELGALLVTLFSFIDVENSPHNIITPSTIISVFIFCKSEFPVNKDKLK